MDCTRCKAKGCRHLTPCTDDSLNYINDYEKSELAGIVKTASKLIDNGRAGSLNRLEEIVEYSTRLGYTHIGVAYCYGMEKEAEKLRNNLGSYGFKLSMVSCTVDGLSESQIDLEKNADIVSCNPLGQAHALNRAKVDFVIIMGLCLGHDVILQKNLQRDFTVFIVKDRVLENNPVLTLNDEVSAGIFLEQLPKDFKIIKIDEFKKKLLDPSYLRSAYLLDLRPPSEFKKNKIDGSQQCLLKNLPGQYKELFPDKNKEVIVYCNGGLQSLYAVMFLTMKGYKEVKSLSGGYSRYLKELA